MFEDKGVKVFSPEKKYHPKDHKVHFHIFVLRELWGKYLKELRPGDIAFIFFAGHGCSFKGKQCLLARGLTKDEKLLMLPPGVTKQMIEESSLQVPDMLKELKEKGIKKHVILLDCCREFRYQNKARAMGQEKFTKGDKAEFNIDISDGTLIGYATRPGKHAYDGKLSHDGHGRMQLFLSLIFLTPSPLGRMSDSYLRVR